MTPESAVHMIHEALMAAFWMAAPLLVIGFAVGVIMNLVQVATSLQDNGFSTFPRLARVSGRIHRADAVDDQAPGSAYTSSIFDHIARYGH